MGRTWKDGHVRYTVRLRRTIICKIPTKCLPHEVGFFVFIRFGFFCFKRHRVESVHSLSAYHRYIKVFSSTTLPDERSASNVRTLTTGDKSCRCVFHIGRNKELKRWMQCKTVDGLLVVGAKKTTRPLYTCMVDNLIMSLLSWVIYIMR